MDCRVHASFHCSYKLFFFLFAAIVALFIVCVFSCYMVMGDLARPLLNATGNGTGAFIKDNFYVYHPDFKTTYIPASIIDIISVKQNLVHEVQGDRFVSSAGIMKSEPFTPAHLMAIPVVGADTNQLALYERRAHVSMNCLANGRVIQLLNAPSESWFLSTVRLPANWCPGQAQIVASSTADSLSVGFGTPLEVSRLFWFLNQPLSSVFSLFLASTAILLLTLPFVLMPSMSILARLFMVAIYPSVVGYLIFIFGWFVHRPPILQFISMIFLFAPALVAAVGSLRQRQPLATDILSSYLIGCAAVAAILLIPRLLLPIGGGMWFPAYAFFPASWSTDNLLSIMAAKSVWLYGAGHPQFLGTWSLADRGVVQAGQMLSMLALPLIGPALLQTQMGFDTLQLFGGMTQGLTIACLAVFFSKKMKSGWPDWAIALFLASTPFLMFNIFYIWPKLDAGLLVCISYIAFWSALRTGQAMRLCLSIAAFYFAALNHSANLICLFSFVFYMILSLINHHHTFAEVKKLALNSWVAAAGTAVVGYAASTLVNKIDPKSSFPITFMLTGHGVFGLDQHETLTFVREFFRNLSFRQFLNIKLQAPVDLIWIQDLFYARVYRGFSFLASLRAREFFSLVPSFGPGLWALAVLRLGQKTSAIPADQNEIADIRATVILFGFSNALNLALVILLFQIRVVVHQIPYGIVLGLFIGLFVWVSQTQKWIKLAAALQALNLFVVWYYGAYLMWNTELYRQFH